MESLGEDASAYSYFGVGLLRRRRYRLTVGITRLHWSAVWIRGWLLLVIVILLATLGIYCIATRKFFLEPPTDSLKHTGSFVNDGLTELDDRRTISVEAFPSSFSAV